ncbi:MAG TPA: T9SS type A sorting domain-containing protein, partial [Bacteroidales bacterium]|nr:T9SS type A sorting domain-containing protein [Bacteroidales bacterium]
EDFPGSAEGKLTTQLTGTSPELQAMLGDGWSYAEGRYPIPLGLENDSMALVAATPVYLHFETEEDYNHADSVTKNFTVSTEVSTDSGIVEFDWNEANGRVSFSDENVTLLNLGVENLTDSLGDYSKNVRINIVDIETSAPIQTIENVISVYPNPASDFINLSLNGVKADKVEIYDITGKLLSTYNLSSDSEQIFTGDLKPGLYFLKICSNDQNISTLRFTKN